MNNTRQWKKLKSKIIYKNPWIKLREDVVVQPGGKKGIYAYLEKDTGAFIIAFNKDNFVYLTRQYRYPIKKIIFDLPGGVTGDHDVLKNAKKELEEETGIKAKKWERLGGFYVAAGHETTYIHVYLATDLESQGQSTNFQEGDESIMKVVKIKVPKLKKMIADGQIECGITIAALNLFFQK
jgi:8-oxo-dGTP pyrophosphatase MutT (NUDIX family)